MRVTEIFTSLQGEGPYAGRHCSFLRLSGCNLHCADCDSSYSWDEGEEKSCYDILSELKKYTPKPPFLNDHIYHHYITVTGGEPLLQADEVGKMIIAAPKTWFWGIETNGTIFDLTKALTMCDVHFIVSPKLPSMHPDGLKRFDKRWAEACIHTIDKVFFKFVVDTEEDVSELVKFMTTHKIPKDKVWIMPKCITKRNHSDKWPWIFDKAIKLGVNASPRLHTMAHGNKRGV